RGLRDHPEGQEDGHRRREVHRRNEGRGHSLRAPQGARGDAADALADCPSAPVVCERDLRDPVVTTPRGLALARADSPKAIGTEYLNSIRTLRALHELPADSRRDVRAPASKPAPDLQVRQLERSRARDAALDAAVKDDAIARALLAAARGDTSVDPYALGDD